MLDSVSFSLTLLIQAAFVPLLAFAYFLYTYSRKAASELTLGPNREFTKFQRTYFIPYFMALFADWLQGPYVYKLYSYYGFAQREIAILYLTGFASSVTFGTATGPLADKFGRKKMTIIFCLTYSICCLTKLSPRFDILMIGRVLGGVSTSILFSVFESWYIHQHTIVRKYPMEWLSITFSQSTFFNGLLAIGAGVLAEIGADWLDFGPVSPFMLAIPFLLFGSYLVWKTWDENYGDKSMNWGTSCGEGLYTILRNPKIFSLGLIQSLFESNMYIFVFMWTPVLEPGKVPLGLTFSTFMIAIMIGSSLYTLLLNRGFTSAHILTLCLALMSSSMLTCALVASPSNAPASVFLIYPTFLILEVACGLYFPAMGYVRGEVIPDALRANIMNWYRVPMNILTCSGLMGLHQLQRDDINQLVFLLCGITAFVGLLVAARFAKMQQSRESSNLSTLKHLNTVT